MSSKNEEMKKQIKRLQSNLKTLRKTAGWTTEELAARLDLTKQTISNLETGRSEMTFVQYIAIRHVLDDEAETNTENTILPIIIDILLDKEDEVEEKEYLYIQKAIVGLSALAETGTPNEMLSSFLNATLPESITKHIVTNAPATIKKKIWYKRFKKYIKKRIDKL